MTDETLYLTEGAREDLLRYCRLAYPREACGFIRGRRASVTTASTPLVGRGIVSIPNVADEPYKTYRMDEPSQLAAYRDFDENGEDPVAIFHSHPVSDPFMSDTDLDLALDLSPLYVIVGPAMRPAILAYRITQPFIGSDVKSWQRVPVVTLDADDPAVTG